ncbi:MAG: CoA protein activase [Firmicutes bacterium]|nr:CoA protein activase [Bacillota bacterium]
MRITFPHMGNLWVGVRAVFEDLGREVVVPPLPSRRSLELGVRHSPEFACFPLKLNVGDFLGALEQGAEVIVMAGGVGPCRFGHYAQVEAQVLRALGHRGEMVVLEPPRGHLGEVVARIRRLAGWRPLGRVLGALGFGWEKLRAADDLERAAARARPLETSPGAVDAAYRRALEAVAASEGIAGTRRAAAEGVRAILEAAGRGGPAVGRPRLRVGLVGEVYMVVETFANQEVERRLGELGVEVSRSVYISDWARSHVFLDALRLTGRTRATLVRRAAEPYLEHFVGGHGRESVGESVLFQREGYDGVVHVAPFTCMPEIVAASLLPELSRDVGLPVLSLFLDEHTGEAGLQTRLEAFVDLLGRRRRLGEKRFGEGRATAWRSTSVSTWAR